MGEFPRHLLHHPRQHPVLPADIHDLQPQAGRQSEYPNDVHPNAGQFRVGGEFGGEAWGGGMERLGGLSGDGVFAGCAFGDGDLF